MTREALLLASGVFEVDSDGLIWRIQYRPGVPCDRRRAERAAGSGYLEVRMMHEGQRLHVAAHRLVWVHFNGAIPDGLVINHRNGVKDDNSPTNLEVVTPAENTRHAVRVLGLMKQDGELNHEAKLTVAQVKTIRRRRAAGERLKAIAADFGVSDRCISKIALGQRWRSVEMARAA